MIWRLIGRNKIVDFGVCMEMGRTIVDFVVKQRRGSELMLTDVVAAAIRQLWVDICAGGLYCEQDT